MQCDGCGNCAYETTNPVSNISIDIARDIGWICIGGEWLCGKCQNEIILPQRSKIKVGDLATGIGMWSDSFFTVGEINYREDRITHDPTKPFRGASSFGNRLPTSFGIVVKKDK